MHQFVGSIETTLDAMRIAVAARRVYQLKTDDYRSSVALARRGIVPRVTRRMNDSERKTLVKSGAVFIFSVEESNIQRWTDGITWSPSRVVRNFLVRQHRHDRADDLSLTSSMATQVYREADVARGSGSTIQGSSAGAATRRPSNERSLIDGSLGPLKANGLFKKVRSPLVT